jgi:cell wall-associated NlpC family hydrolase
MLTLALALCATATASASAAASRQGGISLDTAPAPAALTNPTVPGTVAVLQKDGTAAAPASAPPEVQKAVWAANKIIGKPYIYGGGHRRFNDKGYDCSGTVSFALKGGGLVKTPLDSTSFMSWGEPGEGDWITVYAHGGHAFVVIAGLRLDTSASGDPSGNKGPRWRPALRSTKGFKATHPEAL